MQCCVYFQAKLEASLWWLLHKAFGDQLPSDVQNPFTENDKVRLEDQASRVKVKKSGENCIFRVFLAIGWGSDGRRVGSGTVDS